jgi:hypothetical protein
MAERRQLPPHIRRVELCDPTPSTVLVDELRDERLKGLAGLPDLGAVDFVAASVDFYCPQ